jgi:two-component system, NtrC family, sensor kinase
MPERSPSLINIALVGGGELCKEILEKTTFGHPKEGVSAPILAVADPDPKSPGMQLAKKSGLLTFEDCHELYDPKHHIHLIIILTPDPKIFYDLLATRPTRIRLLSYHVFNLFLGAINREERKLREQKTAMETIVNGLQDFILVISPQMEILDANEPFLRKLGYSREELIGKTCFNIFKQCDQPCYELEVTNCPLLEVKEHKRPAREIQSHIRKDGTLRYYEVNIYPIWEKDGKISKYIHISHDITQRKREEEEITQRLEHMVEERTTELKETHQKMLHQDKMASLGKLSASVVHEINNPIAGILNLVLLVKRMLDEGDTRNSDIDKMGQYLSLMETETRRISRIVSNLLAFSRQTKMKLNQVNFNQLIEKTLFIHSNLLKLNGVEVNKALGKNLPNIIGSEDRLQQVIMNFISNAAEAMEGDKHGLLKIKTHHSLKNNRIIVSIEDTGVGIPQKNKDKLFEPFFTTKKEGKGVGLGLSVAYGIVQEHGGTIDVASKEGEGTTFNLIFPLELAADSSDHQGDIHGNG